MSVAVCRNKATGFESILMLSNREREAAAELVNKNVDNNKYKEAEPPGQLGIWSSIQSQQQQKQQHEQPYVHPLLRRSSTFLSEKSLEICTESLGSETGSDDFFSSSDDDQDEESFFFNSKQQHQQQVEEEEEVANVGVYELESSERKKRKEQTAVNYHCSIKRSSPPRSFPPPLPSMSRRDHPCFQMRPHRRDGRLIVEAVPVPSHNYLHAERHNGRLLLSLINTTATTATPNNNTGTHTQQQEPVPAEDQDQDQDQEEEVILEGEDELEVEEEEVEVVERRTVVEVKVSTQQTQQQSGGAKVHRSSIVINKFVSCTPVDNHSTSGNGDVSRSTAVAELSSQPMMMMRRLPSTTTTTAAAAAVAASSAGSFPAADSGHCESTKLLFTSRRRNTEKLLHDMRRCSELRRPLFIWEPCCIATSI